jgi:prepilin-type N-terminal cleavage/methylation domain-containing protein
MNRRPGVTLIEVLVSIFIMGIGLIALLTLFPLGAVNVAQALRDDRAAQAVANAAAYANAQGTRHLGAGQFTAQLSAGADPNGPSSPVYLDPFYVDLGAGRLGVVAGVPNSGIARVKPAYAAATSTEYWFALHDDLNFDTDGRPTTTGANAAVERTGRYTWAYMLRRPQLGDESVVEMSTVVYADRSTQSVAGETVYATAAAPAYGTNSLTLSYTKATKPRIRNGSWILDVTPETYRNSVTGATYTVVRGYFYRVVDASDNDGAVGGPQYTLELQNPLRSPPGNGLTAVSANARFVVMENVIDVFDRGTGYTP